jgi:hypothetical protein
MNATLPIKYQLTNCMIKCNVGLMLFLFLSVSFINLAEARDISSQEKLIYGADFEYVADSTPEYDSGDDSVDIAYDVRTNIDFALNIIAVQARTIHYFNYAYLRPLSRASPKSFI